MGKGKSSSQEMKINPELAAAAKENYGMAQQIAKLGYQPNRGVTIAGFTPQQQAAMSGNVNAASAFGLPTAAPMAGMPPTETSATGIQGYSTGAEYDDMLSKLPAGYRAQIDSFFNDPNAMPSKASGGGGGGKGGKGVSTPMSRAQSQDEQLRNSWNYALGIRR